MLTSTKFSNAPVLLAGLLIVAFGAWLRLSDSFAGALGPGYDERLYSSFLDTLRQTGSYPDLVKSYLAGEAGVSEKRVSPMRCLPLLHAWAWSSLSGRGSYQSLMDVSAMVSILMLPLSGALGYRLGGNRAGLAITALMSVAPLQVYMAHRSLMDGYFSFWMLLMMWLLWECLEGSHKLWPPLLLGASWTLLLLCKETSAFVWLGTLLALLFVRTSEGRWPGPRTWAALALGPAVGLALLLWLCGGPSPFLALIQAYLTKQMPQFVLLHANGPWWGYLLASLILSPLVSLMAWGGLLGVGGKERSSRLLAVISLTTLAIPTAFPLIVPRLLTAADFPLRWLCWMQIRTATDRIKRPEISALLTAVLVAGLCAAEFANFYLIFQKNGVYEPTCDVLLWVFKVVPQI